jgi:hypothetical protein
MGGVCSIAALKMRATSSLPSNFPATLGEELVTAKALGGEPLPPSLLGLRFIVII